jgi:hypothetical protein
MKQRMRIIVWGMVAALAVGLLGCGGTMEQDDPRKVVIAMFGAMEKNDKPALAHLLDLVALMQAGPEDYSLGGGEPRRWTDPEQMLNDLTGDGLTKTRWFGYQRIVNDAEVTGETATVEVTFVDKEASRGYRTKFGVHVVDGKWKVYSFKMIQSEK